MGSRFKVSVQCVTYNQVSYIEDAMNGFCMQKTSFPFVCIILDDASTDGEPEIIRKYLQEHFDMEAKSVVNQETNDYVMSFAQHKKNHNCYFAVYYLKYNHWSINKKKLPYSSVFLDRNQYYAVCEGDDYWIDPMKLQSQFDYMEQHPDCTMTCSRAKIYSELKGKYTGEQYCRKSDGLLSSIDIINRTGLYIPTCSIFFRPWIQEDYPDYCQKCKVGDYPLQITAALKGGVFYFNKCMCVYRIENKTSWMGQQHHESVDPARLKVVYGQTKMFEGFAKDYPKYRSVFQEKISEHILRNMPSNRCNNNDSQKYQEFFSEEYRNLRLKWKIYSVICLSGIPYLKKIYSRIVLRKYRPKVCYYNNLIKRMLVSLQHRIHVK